MDMTSVSISTSRLALRTWTPADLPLALSLWGNKEVTKYVTAGGCYSEAQITARFEGEMAMQGEHGVSYWPFFLLANTDANANTDVDADVDAQDAGAEGGSASVSVSATATAIVSQSFVGVCGLRPLVGHPPDCLELGIHSLPLHWGQGIGREMASAVLDWAFTCHGTCTSVFAGHHPDNVASEAFLLSLGFVAAPPRLYVPTGLMHNSYWVRKSQYEEARRSPIESGVSAKDKAR